MTDTDFTLSRRRFWIACLPPRPVLAWAPLPLGRQCTSHPATGGRVRLGVIGTGSRGRALIQHFMQTRN